MNTTTMSTGTEYVIFVIAGGFYYFGKEVETQEGWLALTEASMFRGFQGGKGVPGVTRGDENAEVKLDQFEQDKVLYFPVSACYGIQPSINLYKFKGSTINA